MAEFIGEVRASILGLLAESKLSPAQKIVYLAIRQYVQKNWGARPSVGQLVQMTGLTPRGVERAKVALRSCAGVWLDDEWIAKSETGLPSDKYFGRYRVEQLSVVARMLSDMRVKRDRRKRVRQRLSLAPVITLVHILTFVKERSFHTDDGTLTVRCYSDGDFAMLAKQSGLGGMVGRKYLSDLLKDLRDLDILRPIGDTKCYTINLPDNRRPEPEPEVMVIKAVKKEPPAEEKQEEIVTSAIHEQFNFDNMEDLFLRPENPDRTSNIEFLRGELERRPRLRDLADLISPRQKEAYDKLLASAEVALLDPYLDAAEAEKALGRPLEILEKAFYVGGRHSLRIRFVPSLPAPAWTPPETKETVRKPVMNLTREQVVYWKKYLTSTWTKVYQEVFRPGSLAGNPDHRGLKSITSLVEKMNGKSWGLSEIDAEEMERCRRRIWAYFRLACETAKKKKAAFTLPWLDNKFEELRIQAEEENVDE